MAELCLILNEPISDQDTEKKSSTVGILVLIRFYIIELIPKLKIASLNLKFGITNRVSNNEN